MYYIFSDDKQRGESNVENDKIVVFVNEDAPGIEPVRLLNDEDDAAATGFAKSGWRAMR